MRTTNRVDAENRQFELLVELTRTVIHSGQVTACRAPAFLKGMADAMSGLAADLRQNPATAAGASSENRGFGEVETPDSDDGASSAEASTGEETEDVRRARRAAKARELFGAQAVDARTGDADMPAIAAVLNDFRRRQQPKRGRGRPSKKAAAEVRKATDTRRQRAFDRMFREKYPPLEGLDRHNTVADDAITIIFTGEKRVSIKRYLRDIYGIGFDDYCRIYGLGDDYPSMAANERRARRETAIASGLGVVGRGADADAPMRGEVRSVSADRPLKIAAAG